MGEIPLSDMTWEQVLSLEDKDSPTVGSPTGLLAYRKTLRKLGLSSDDSGMRARTARRTGPPLGGHAAKSTKKAGFKKLFGRTGSTLARRRNRKAAKRRFGKR